MTTTAEHACDQAQCQSADIKTRHSGYVKHRTNGEKACESSKEGHRLYMQQQRQKRGTNP